MSIGADSVNPQALINLPVVPDFYLGYVDGRYADYQAIAAEHGGKPVFGLTVFGNPAEGAGTDSEPGDATIAQTVQSTRGELARGVDRPLVYCPASWGTAMVAAHTGGGVDRSTYRLVLAHYNGKHICGPATCGYEQADATQWIDHGSWDETVADDNFLAAAPHPGPAPAPAPPPPPHVGAPVPLEDNVTEIPGSVTLDPNGNGYVDVNLGAGKDRTHVVNVEVDVAPPDGPNGGYPDKGGTAEVAIDSPAGFARVVFTGFPPRQYLTFRVFVG